MGHRGDRGDRGDPGQQEPSTEQRRIEADAEVQAAFRQPEAGHQPAQHQQADHAEHVEQTGPVAHPAAHQRLRTPDHGERCTEQETAGAAERAEVQRFVDVDAPAEQRPVTLPLVGRAGCRDVSAMKEQGHDQGDRHAGPGKPQRQAWPQATGVPHQHGDHHQWPEEVVLLLDRERPQVAERNERLVGRVPLSDRDLVPVADVEDAAGEVAPGASHRRSPEQGHEHCHPGEHHEQGRQQPAEPASPELAEVDPTSTFVLADQEQGDEVAADDEEHLDAEEPAGEPCVVGVIDHHRHHGERPHPVEPRQIRQAAAL